MSVTLYRRDIAAAMTAVYHLFSFYDRTQRETFRTHGILKQITLWEYAIYSVMQKKVE